MKSCIRDQDILHGYHPVKDILWWWFAAKVDHNHVCNQINPNILNGFFRMYFHCWYYHSAFFYELIDKMRYLQESKVIFQSCV
jgi:hypothetical protein